MGEAMVEEDQVDSSKINEITRLQKIQVVAEEEETLEEGGAEEEEVDGNRDKTIILMYVGFVEDMVTMQMTIIKGLITKGQVEEINKEIMCLHQTMIVMGIYLLCNI